MPNPYINRVDISRGGTTETLINIGDTTAVAADVAQGKYFYLATGEKVAGTSSGGTGGITQDQDGYLVLDDEGGGGGGGGSSYTLIDSMEVEVSTTSTSVIDIDTYTLTRTNPSGEILYIQVRDKAGKRNGYFLGFDYYLTQPVGGSQSNNYRQQYCYVTGSSGSVTVTSTSNYGVFPSLSTISGSSYEFGIKARYHATYSTTIDGTYSIKVYSLKWPDNTSPFA